MSRVKVLDSNALIVFFQNEPGAEKVEQIIIEGITHQESRRNLLSVVNWGEIYYSIMRKQGEHTAEQKLRDIERMNIEIVPVDQELTKQAAHFKAKHSIAYADCFAAALAKMNKADLVTGDSEFKLVEKEINIIWI